MMTVQRRHCFPVVISERLLGTVIPFLGVGRGILLDACTVWEGMGGGPRFNAGGGSFAAEMLCFKNVIL
jgi:hypothetical protein